MKSKFVKSTIILIIGGFLTKVIGMCIRMVMARSLGSSGMGIYMLIMPTFTLFISLAGAGFPVAISKLVSENRYNNKNIVFSILPVSLLLNFILLLIIYFGSSFISTYLLKEEKCTYALISIGFVLPFTSISSILRGYFFGKEKMFPHVISNLTEDFIRLILLYIGIPIFLKNGIEYACAYIVLTNIVSELTSIIILFFFLPKNFTLTREDLVPKRKTIHDVFGISIPTTGSRIIGSIGYFLEPIILIWTLNFVGYSNNFITREYGILNGYVMPLLLLPSFFTMAISGALIPIVSKFHAHKKCVEAKKKIHQGLFFSLIIGIPVTLIFILIPNIPLNFIYHTNEGITYMKILAPICLFHYVQGILSSSLQAMGKAKLSMKGTFYGTLIKTISLFLFSLFKIGIYGLIISVGVNMIFVTLYDGINVRKELKE